MFYKALKTFAIKGSFAETSLNSKIHTEMQRFAFKLMVVQSAYLIWKLYCHQVQVQIVCILLMPPPKQTSEAQNPNFQLPMYGNRAAVSYISQRQIHNTTEILPYAAFPIL